MDKYSWIQKLQTPNIKNYKLELNSFSCNAFTKTYARHRNSGCCLYIIAEIWNQRIPNIANSKLQFVLFMRTSFFLQPKQSRFLPPHLVNSLIMFIRKDSYWRRIPRTIRCTWYYNIFAVLVEKYKLLKNKEIASRR